MEGSKIMRKTFSIAMLVVLVFCTGCAARKVAITPQKFTEIVEAAGFEVVDTTAIYESSLIQQSLGANNNVFVIELSVALSEAEANQIFNQTKNKAELSKGNSAAESSTAFGNKANYRLSAAGIYYVLSKIDNTVICVQTEIANKSAVDEIVKKLGY